MGDPISLFRYNIQQRIPTSHHDLSPSLALSPSLSHMGQSLYLKQWNHTYYKEIHYVLNHIKLEKVFLGVTYLNGCSGCYLLIVLLESCCFMGSWHVSSCSWATKLGKQPIVAYHSSLWTGLRQEEEGSGHIIQIGSFWVFPWDVTYILRKSYF